MCGGVRYSNLSPATAAAAAAAHDHQIHNRSIHSDGGDDDLLLISPPFPAPKSPSPMVGLSIIAMAAASKPVIADPPCEEDNSSSSRIVGQDETLCGGGRRRPSLTEDVLTATAQKSVAVVVVVEMSMSEEAEAEAEEKAGEKAADSSSYAAPAGAAAHKKDMADQGKEAPRIEVGVGVGVGADKAGGFGRPVIGDARGQRARGHGHGHGHGREEGARGCRRSIFFTAASPPASAGFPRPALARYHSLPASFGQCFWCTRPLTPHTDLYMYRGDRAFCSSECRYKQMDVDEQNERQTVNIAWKHDQSSNNNKVNYHATTVEIVG